MNENDVREPWWFRHPLVASIMGIILITLICFGVYAAKVTWVPVVGQ